MLKPPLQPMLLGVRKEPFNSREYIFEFKWDGYRCLAFIDKGKLFLQSRNKKDLTPCFPEFKKLPDQLKTDSLILDGEICMLNDQGHPSFEALQGIIGSVKKRNRKNASLIVWDILAVNQKNIFSRTLMERKEVLNQMISESSLLIKSPYIRKKGQELY
ncbi:MAG TPA: hypothetical protein VKY40_04455, partial [Halanaerobiales bacterium]|nr:hypothetical protein [Halanaerobiales bacterium]